MRNILNVLIVPQNLQKFVFVTYDLRFKNQHTKKTNTDYPAEKLLTSEPKNTP